MYLVRHFNRAISNLKLNEKCSDLCRYENNSILVYFLSKHWKSTKLFKRHIERIYNNEPIDIYKKMIQETCVGPLAPFAVCQQYDIEKFTAAKIVTDFCGQKLSDILHGFESLICKYLSCLSGDVRDAYNKTVDTHFTITLAQIFSCYKFAKSQNLNITKCLSIMILCRGNFISRDLFNECLTNDSSYIMSNNSIGDNDTKSIIVLLFNKYCDLYNFITNRDVTELMEFSQENPDFKILTSKYLANKSHISTSYVYKFFIKSEYFYLCDIIANKPHSSISNTFNIQSDVFPQNNLVIEI